ncbi:MAG TPA: helix-turn-helix domain-containing protein, partial [Acidimicrobiales bacterium]
MTGPEADVVGERPMRADARRNRELLIDAAREVFSAQGAAASMEAIAKAAGVGVGTLYRHFPNRLDLVEAVYQTDVAELWETAQRVSADLEPWPAVEAFFEAFLRYARTK